MGLPAVRFIEGRSLNPSEGLKVRRLPKPGVVLLFKVFEGHDEGLAGGSFFGGVPLEKNVVLTEHPVIV